MSGPPEDPQIQSTDHASAQAEDVPVLVAEDPSAARIVLPVRRSTATDSPARAEAGLRIESRIHTGPAESAESATGSKLEISELGKGIVRLGSETAVSPGPPRQDQLPVMQPRRSRSNDKAEATVWGQSRAHSHRWMIWSGLAVAVVIAGGLAIQPLLAKKADAPRTTYYDKIQIMDDVTDPDDPMVYFSDHSDEASQQMVNALTAYARARTLDEVVPLVRNGDSLRDMLKTHWHPWNVPPDWTPAGETAQGFSSVGKLPYGTMAGSLPDFSNYAVYFVRSGGRMLVDWEATTGAGTANMAGLNDASTTEAVVRVLISPTAFYTATYPESAFQAYQASRPDSDEIAWLYVERDSIAGGTLGKMFQAGDILGRADTSPQRVRVRLAKAEQGSLSNQWTVLDVLHKGWVSP